MAVDVGAATALHDSTPRTSPHAWRTVRFDQMAQNIADRVDNPSEAGVDRYVGLEHLDPESLKVRRWGHPSDVEATKLRFKPGDVIFGRRRAYQRKLAVADFEGICSAHAMVLRACEDTVLKGFLPFFMQSDLFFDRALQISVGSLSPTINWSALSRQEFTIPPLDEQRRIADILLAAEVSKEAYRHCLDQAERARRTVLADLVMRGIGHDDFRQTEAGAIPSTWTWARVTDVGHVQMGRQRAPQYATGRNAHPYLRVANVFDGYLDLTDVLSMDFNERDFERYVLAPGDILLNEGQSRELVGRSCIYQGEINGCCYQNTLIRYRCHEEILPEYAHAYFQLSLYSGRFAQIAKQTTSIAHLGADRFARFPIPVPPLNEQQDIVRQLAQLINARDRIRVQLDSIIGLSKQLASRLMDINVH